MLLTLVPLRKPSTIAILFFFSLKRVLRLRLVQDPVLATGRSAERAIKVN